MERDIEIIKNSSLTKQQQNFINKARKKAFGKETEKDFSKDYEKETQWFFVKKQKKIVALGGIRPITAQLLKKRYKIGGVCCIIALEKKKGYGRDLIQAMIDYAKRTNKTLLGFTKKTEFFKKVGMETKKDLIKRFVWVKPDGEKVYDDDGDGLYLEGKNNFIQKLLKTKSPVFILVEHW